MTKSEPLPGQRTLPGVMDYDIYKPSPKILAFADVHLGNYKYPIREYAIRILDEITQIAKREKPDAIFFAGDAFRTRVPSARDVSGFGHFLSVLAAIAPVYAISGNHDVAGGGATTLGVYNHYSRVHIIESPKVRTTDEFQLVAVPWLPQRSLASDGMDVGSNRGTIEALLIALQSQLDLNKPAFLLAHCTTLGSKYDDSTLSTVSHDVLWQAEWFSGFNWCFLGHIHKPQQVAENASYTGSTCPTSFNEAGQKKYVSIFENGKCRTVQLKSAPMFLKCTPSTIPTDIPDNAFIQIKKEHKDLAPPLPDCAWAEVLSVPPPRDTRQRLEDAFSLSPEGAMAAFLEGENYKPGEVQDVLALARKLTGVDDG